MEKCKFCQIEHIDIRDDYGNILSFGEPNKIIITVDLGLAGMEFEFEINYCPMCGRKLERSRK